MSDSDRRDPLASDTHRGAAHEGDGTRFALYSGVAEAVELCLYDAAGNETARHPLENDADVWRTFVPGCRPGQRYGYRVHGPYDPAAGLRCNPHKLLLDPYARQLAGDFVWHEAVTGYSAGDPLDGPPCTLDSAPYVPKAVVTGATPIASRPSPRNWNEAAICELNVRGYTMRHPELTAAERGRFAGLANGKILEHLKALGITTVELLPVHAFIDEKFLHDHGLRNYWGYNSISFFAPTGRYSADDPTGEFRAMVDAIHDAGLEVLLDVVYNHTGETDEYGPTLSFRGIDNQAYYRTEAGAAHLYVNDTGCGNTLNADHPEVQALVLASLDYWHNSMGVDGFRFDLAPVLGRHAHGFAADHPLLKTLENSPQLRDARLIAEPWDIGPGGYQTGNFGPRWAEWNDAYRDAVRRYWRGDDGQAGAFAEVVHGSAERYEHKGSGPDASINFVTAHDGYTLADLVMYERRHNIANRHDNRDGHSHNYSHNHGHEGPTDGPAINALRRRQRLNMLATLLVSGGTPMLLGGDEIGHSQQGNNNAYCQDNELTWLDWPAADQEFCAEIAGWVQLRKDEPLLRPAQYLHGEHEVLWWHPEGRPMNGADWPYARAFALLQSGPGPAAGQIAILFNPEATETRFTLPGAAWQLLRATGALAQDGTGMTLQSHSIAVAKAGSQTF